MNENKIKVQINKPVAEVFEFSTNPRNTSKWFGSIAEEETSEWPIKLGTIYRNRGETGDWNECVVSQLKENEVFELSSKKTSYHVRYTYTDLGDKTELEYHEWMGEGELDGAVRQETLDKLKEIMEK